MSTARKGCFLLTGFLAMVGLNGCEAFRVYPKNIREFPEPWKVLEPGDPRPKFPTPRVISEGTGPVIGPGDLVQMHILTKFGRPEPKWQSDGNWWLWIGFRKREETSFFADEPRVASALVGLREGSVLEFVEAKDEPGIDSRYAGTLNVNVFGDPRSYAWRKNILGGDVNIYVSTSRTPSTVEIKRVCKGQAKYRTVRLFDDSPVRTGSGFKTKVTREPRELWIDEAKIEATCGDGRKAVFQYGPTGSKSGGKPRFVVTGYFDDWLYEAWKKLDVGVQFEGNRPPRLTRTSSKRRQIKRFGSTC